MIRWVDVNGASLRCDIMGEGPPLVLVHEMGGTLESWDYVAPHLPGWRLIRYDMRGAGLSQKLVGPVTLDDLVDDLAGLLDELGETGPVALAGCAVGAAVALAFCARFPDRAAGLVAMAPATGMAPERRAEGLKLADTVEREGLRARLVSRIDISFPEAYRGGDGAHRVAQYRGNMLSNDPRSYAMIYRMLAGMDLVPLLPRIGCPVLVLAGETDGTRPAALVRPVADAIPGAIFREVPSGHVMALLTPVETAGWIGEFIRRAIGAPQHGDAGPTHDQNSSIAPPKLV